MNEVRIAKIFNLTIEEGYTFILGFYVLDDNGQKELSGFSGKKFHNHQDYETWKTGVENVIDRRFEDGKGASIKVIINDEETLGIGNLSENYWIVLEKSGDGRKYEIKNKKEEIDEFFKRNNIINKTQIHKKYDVER